jgi:hypothetical protein
MIEAGGQEGRFCAPTTKPWNSRFLRRVTRLCSVYQIELDDLMEFQELYVSWVATIFHHEPTNP